MRFGRSPSARSGRTAVLKSLLATILVSVSAAAFVATGPIGLNAARPAERYPVPEGGTVARGFYQNEYFGMRYPLPEGWREDVKGPPPSVSGYYSLAALRPGASLAATLLIAAQDNFFAPHSATSATNFLDQMKDGLDPSLVAPGPPVSMKIAGQSFARLEYSGAGLRHVIFATEIRCHTVLFSLTSGDSETIDALVQSLNKIVFSAGNPARPICVQEDATADHVIHRVEPALPGPRFASIPARIVVGANGRVEQVHVIGGLPEQARSIQEALSQWTFKPYMFHGEAGAVETGVMVRSAATP
jgi:hypothetical protein